MDPNLRMLEMGWVSPLVGKELRETLEAVLFEVKRTISPELRDRIDGLLNGASLPRPPTRDLSTLESRLRDTAMMRTVLAPWLCDMLEEAADAAVALVQATPVIGAAARAAIPWIRWVAASGPCPLPPETRIEVCGYNNDGEDGIGEGQAIHFCWTGNSDQCNTLIVESYRVIP